MNNTCKVAQCHDGEMDNMCIVEVWSHSNQVYLRASEQITVSH